MNTPSIGSIGLTVDETNKRVKVLCEQEFQCAEEAQNFLIGVVGRIDEALSLLKSADARVTSRVLLPAGMSVPQFRIDGLVIREEARIRVNQRMNLDIVYLGGNGPSRMDLEALTDEITISTAVAIPAAPMSESTGSGVTFERLRHPVSAEDVAQLLEMYQLCFTSYLVPLDEVLVQGAASNSIFIVARNERRQIIASAIGESLRVGPVTLLEVSEEVAHPTLRIKGAASGCARRVIAEGKRTLTPPVVAFWEARMWRNILGMGPRVGLTEYAGVLHQHCLIASPDSLTTIRNKGEFGSLAVFYAP